MIAEGSANYGIDLAFPGDEQLAFEPATLYPLAGPAERPRRRRYLELQRAMRDLAGARFTIARDYLEGRIDKAEAIRLTQKYQLQSQQRAEKSIAFTDQYRTYVINYGLGQDMVRAAVERAGSESASAVEADGAIAQRTDAAGRFAEIGCAVSGTRRSEPTRRHWNSSTAGCTPPPTGPTAPMRSWPRSVRPWRRRGTATRRFCACMARIIAPSWKARMRDWLAAGRTGDAFPYTFPMVGRRPLDLKRIDARLGQYSFDTATPIGPGTWTATRAAADTALTALDAVLGGDRAAFALTRPPGHHAGADYCGGYSYLNHAAIAAEAALPRGGSGSRSSTSIIITATARRTFSTSAPTSLTPRSTPIR